MFAKFEVCSFSHSRDILWRLKFEMGHMTKQCSFQGRSVVHRLGSTMLKMSTKFEVSMFTHYNNMKGNAKCRNLGGLGQLGVTQAHRQHNHSIECKQLPIQLK